MDSGWSSEGIVDDDNGLSLLLSEESKEGKGVSGCCGWPCFNRDTLILLPVCECEDKLRSSLWKVDGLERLEGERTPPLSQLSLLLPSPAGGEARGLDVSLLVEEIVMVEELPVVVVAGLAEAVAVTATADLVRPEEEEAVMMTDSLLLCLYGKREGTIIFCCVGPPPAAAAATVVTGGGMAVGEEEATDDGFADDDDDGADITGADMGGPDTVTPAPVPTGVALSETAGLEEEEEEEEKGAFRCDLKTLIPSVLEHDEKGNPPPREWTLIELLLPVLSGMLFRGGGAGGG